MVLRGPGQTRGLRHCAIWSPYSRGCRDTHALES